MRKPSSVFLDPSTKEFADLAYAVSMVYPWVKFPIRLRDFANDVFRHIWPVKELLDTAYKPDGVLASFLATYFHIRVHAYGKPKGSRVKLYTPKDKGLQERMTKRLQAARDRTLALWL